MPTLEHAEHRVTTSVCTVIWICPLLSTMKWNEDTAIKHQSFFGASISEFPIGMPISVLLAPTILSRSFPATITKQFNLVINSQSCSRIISCLSTSMSGPPSLRIAECTPYLTVSGLRRTWSCRLGTGHSQAQAFHLAAANEQKPCVFNQSLETTNLRTAAQYHIVTIGRQCSEDIKCVCGVGWGVNGGHSHRKNFRHNQFYLLNREFWFGLLFHDILCTNNLNKVWSAIMQIEKPQAIQIISSVQICEIFRPSTLWIYQLLNLFINNCPFNTFPLGLTFCYEIIQRQL